MANEGSAERLKTFGSEREVLDIVERFRARTLPKERWTHQAHLVVGLWFVMNRPSDLVLGELRRGISAYNESVGTANTDSDGYHETITAFYVWAIRKFVSEKAPESSLLALANDLLTSRFAAASFPFRYYSRDRLLSVAARRAWLGPDLSPIDWAPDPAQATSNTASTSTATP
jgi:hypothetical protein